MYVVDDNVFIHVVKSGGTSIRKLLVAQRLNDIKFSSEHFPIAIIPEKYKNYKRHALVRDPVGWYKSFYAYTLQLKSKGESFNRLADSLVFKGKDKVSFDEFVDRAINLKAFVNTDGRLEDIINKTRKNRIMKPSYFSLVFDDYTDIEGCRSLISDTCYQTFMNFVGAYDADEYYVLENKEDMSRLYDVFKIKNTGLSHMNKTKNKFVVNDVSVETIEKIHKAEEYTYTKFKMEI